MTWFTSIHHIAGFIFCVLLAVNHVRFIKANAAGQSSVISGQIARRQAPLTEPVLSAKDAKLKALLNDFPTLKAPNALPFSQNYEMSDIALVLSVDGTLHALKRATGQWVWSLHDNDAKRISELIKPVVDVDRGMVMSASRSKGSLSNSTGLSAINSSGPESTDTEETYIVEPGDSGAIYIRSPNSNGLQKLPLTLPQLVDMSPFTFPTDDSRMFVGKKSTSMVSVDLATGKLVGLFGPDNGWCEWYDKRGMNTFENECEDDIENRPRDLLYLGKTGECFPTIDFVKTAVAYFSW